MFRNIFYAALLSVAATVVVGCGASHKDNEEKEHDEHHADEITFTQKQAKDAGMRTETVTAGDFVSVVKVGGQIANTTGSEQTVAATASGIVSFANGNITEGSAINAGQTVVTISAKKLQDGDPAAKARAEYVAAEAAYKRAEQLVADRIIAQKEYEEARLRYETARTAYQATAASLSANGVSVAAPAGGYVKNLLVRQGDYVNVGDPIATITQNKRLQLRAEVPERYFKNLRNVSGANFRTSYDKAVYSLSSLGGRLISYGKASTEGSAYLPVTFEFNNVGDFIPGSFVEVFLLLDTRRDVISVPVSALTEDQGLYYVFTQVKGEKESYLKREVTLGMNNGERVEITRGLAVGDIVVTHGAHQVRLASATAKPEGHNHNH